MSMVSDRDPATGYDWSARVRTTTVEALRYSRFVVLMKRILALGAFLIIAAVGGRLAYRSAQQIHSSAGTKASKSYRR